MKACPPQQGPAYREPTEKAGLLLAWALVVNVLFVRHVRQVAPELELLSFKLVIDWVLLAYVAHHLLKGWRYRIPGLWWAGFSVGLIVIFNLVLGGLNNLALRNLWSLLAPLTVLAFFACLMRTLSVHSRDRFLFRLCWALNMYFFANAVLIVIQIRTENFMMASSLEANPNAIDHMTGLIGMNGVGTLNYLWIATTMINLASWFTKGGRFLAILIFCQLGLMGIISRYNENKMFVPTMAIFIASFFFLRVMGGNSLGKKLASIYIGLWFASSPLFVWSLLRFRDLPDPLSNVVELFLFQRASPPDFHNERALLNYLAFTKYDGWGAGLGLANVDVLNSNIHEHLGINSATLVLIQGGLVLLVALTALYVALSLGLFATVRPAVVAVVTATMILTAYASQPFFDHYLIVCLALSYFGLSYALRASAAWTRRRRSVSAGARIRRESRSHTCVQHRTPSG